MSELVSSKQIEDLVNKIVEEKLENYFRMSRPGFEIVSGHKVPGHGIGEFCMTTDTTQGLHFYEGGRGKMGANQSIEIYGGDGGVEDGKINKKEDYGIVIEAINGSVLIKAQHDLVLQGKQVKIQAQELLQLASGSKIDIVAPTISSEANNNTAIGINDLRLYGGDVDVYAEDTVDVAEGVDDLLNTDVVSRITSLIDDSKRVFGLI